MYDHNCRHQVALKKKETDGFRFCAVSVSEVQEVEMGEWAQLECQEVSKE